MLIGYLGLSKADMTDYELMMANAILAVTCAVFAVFFWLLVVFYQVNIQKNLTRKLDFTFFRNLKLHFSISGPHSTGNSRLLHGEKVRDWALFLRRITSTDLEKQSLLLLVSQ